MNMNMIQKERYEKESIWIWAYLYMILLNLVGILFVTIWLCIRKGEQWLLCSINLCCYALYIFDKCIDALSTKEKESNLHHALC